MQQGVQGREIWSVDLYQSPASKRILCATSAEDNTIKISEYISRGYDGEAHGTSDLKTLYRFPDPDGTLQNVCWAESVHEEGETVLLFVTAAKERLYALRVQLSASTSNIKVIRLGQVVRERSVSEDSRTMALDVVKLSTTDDQTDDHAILVGSSDGSLKVSLSSKRRINARIIADVASAVVFRRIERFF